MNNTEKNTKAARGGVVASWSAWALVIGISMPAGHALAAEPTVYETPEAAAQALLDALGSGQQTNILAVLGDEFADELFTEEESLEQLKFQNIVNAAAEAMQLREDNASTRTMVIGKDAWPMPIPLVQGETGWSFDTALGIDEILLRAIGRNELTTIETLQSYITAQMEYAGTDRDNDGVLEYAQRVMSTQGAHDGLYWQSAEGDADISPFGAFIAEMPVNIADRESTEPYMGYYYRILSRQGGDVPGGRYDYVINGNMIGGFAAIAVPAEYLETGVMTFIVSHQGKIYESDLGEDTELLAAAIQEFNLGPSWTQFLE